mmetsp:Transcript_3256/g.9270  ORF Transcript_3256/g.9270 Transcript_3256/m.9270 type:complete len:230 (-) Transcript_3256:2713-3402(-)
MGRPPHAQCYCSPCCRLHPATPTLLASRPPAAPWTACRSLRTTSSLSCSRLPLCRRQLPLHQRLPSEHGRPHQRPPLLRWSRSFPRSQKATASSSWSCCSGSSRRAAQWQRQQPCCQFSPAACSSLCSSWKRLWKGPQPPTRPRAALAMQAGSFLAWRASMLPCLAPKRMTTPRRRRRSRRLTRTQGTTKTSAQAPAVRRGTLAAHALRGTQRCQLNRRMRMIQISVWQ